MFQYVNELFEVILFLRKFFACVNFYPKGYNHMDQGYTNERPESALQSHPCVEGEWWWDRVIRIIVAPSVKLRPQHRVCHPEESDLVCRRDGPRILNPETEGELLGVVVVEDAEQAQAGGEEGQDGEDPPAGGKESPQHDAESGCCSEYNFLIGYRLDMKSNAGPQTEQHRDAQHQLGVHGNSEHRVLVEDGLQSSCCSSLC